MWGNLQKKDLCKTYEICLYPFFFTGRRGLNERKRDLNSVAPSLLDVALTAMLFSLLNIEVIAGKTLL